LEVADDACGMSSTTEICGGDGTHMWNKIMLARDMERGFGIEIEIVFITLIAICLFCECLIRLVVKQKYLFFLPRKFIFVQTFQIFSKVK